MLGRVAASVSLAATTDEVQTVVAARRLASAKTVFIGVGRPSTAAILARMVHNPDLVLIYESGTIGAKPFHIPLSIGDGELSETADAVVGVPEMFNYWIGAGRVDVGVPRRGTGRSLRQSQLDRDRRLRPSAHTSARRRRRP